jgi:flagellar biosynthesis/type III secretory pathway M-ring protein FliF/YscJ
MEAMDLIRRFLLQTKTALAGLTVSQKLCIGLLAVILLAAVFWTVVGSSKPEMVTLVSQSMTADQIAQAEMALKGKYAYQVSGDRILVPFEKAYQIRGELGSQGLLPRDLSTDFDAEIQKMGLLSSEAQNERQWMLARQKVLTKFLLSFPYVQDGSVIISVGQPQALGRAAMPSTATVNLKTKGNVGLSSSQVQAVAETVSGAVSGMRREDVHVIVNGQPYRAPSSDTPMPANLVEYKKTIEDYLTTKLMAQFSGYGDSKISVNVVPDLSSKTKQETLVDPKNVVSRPLMVRSQETSSSDGGVGAGGEPGVKPNTGISVSDTATAGTGRGSGSTSTISQEENKVVVGQTTISSLVPAGVELKDLTASISLPRSYFVSVYRNRLRDPKAEPKDQAEEEKFQADIIGPELKRAMALAKNVIGAKEDQQVKVDWYDDSIMAKMPEVAAAAGTPFATGTLPILMQYAKQGVLALVALGALGMMLRMVKRAVPAGAEGEVDPSMFFGSSGGGGSGSGGGKKGKKRVGNVEQLDATEDVFGEANQGEAVLTGIELDDETLASRKMVDEVSTMIKDNPENAAALVKRWMAKNK